MAYPNQPNFLAPQADAVWWLARVPAGTGLCQTDGLTFARAVQLALQQAIPSAPSPEWRDWNNASPVGGTTRLVVDGKWGPLTMRALYAYLQHFDAPVTLREAVRYDAEARTLTAGSIAAGVWVIERARPGATTGHTSETLFVRRDLVPLRWSAASPAPPGWSSTMQLNCRLLRAEDPVPAELPAAWLQALGRVPPPPDPDGNITLDDSGALDDSATTVRDDDDDAATGATPMPPPTGNALDLPPPKQAGGAPWWLLAGVGVLAAVGGGLLAAHYWGKPAAAAPVLVAGPRGPRGSRGSKGARGRTGRRASSKKSSKKSSTRGTRSRAAAASSSRGRRRRSAGSSARRVSAARGGRRR